MSCVLTYFWSEYKAGASAATLLPYRENSEIGVNQEESGTRNREKKQIPLSFV
jgi:hypothetical protein